MYNSRSNYWNIRGARQAVEGDATDGLLRPRVRRGHSVRQPVRYRARRAGRQPNRCVYALVILYVFSFTFESN